MPWIDLAAIVRRGLPPLGRRTPSARPNRRYCSTRWSASVADRGDPRAGRRGGRVHRRVLVDRGRVAPGSARPRSSAICVHSPGSAPPRAMTEWRLDPPTAACPQCDEIWRLLLAEAPELVGELALVAAAAEELPRLFAEGPHALRRRRSARACAGRRERRSTSSAVRCAAEIAAAWPQGRPLRVLELGAGGTATRRLLDCLAQTGVALSYIAASPDPDQAARLVFATKPLTGATAQYWAPLADGDEFDRGSFDIVLSVNACRPPRPRCRGAGTDRRVCCAPAACSSRSSRRRTRCGISSSGSCAGGRRSGHRRRARPRSGATRWRSPGLPHRAAGHCRPGRGRVSFCGRMANGAAPAARRRSRRRCRRSPCRARAACHEAGGRLRSMA